MTESDARPRTFNGSRVKVQESNGCDGTFSYDVLLDRKVLLATCADAEMANVLARAADAYVPAGANTATAGRFISYAFTAMPGARLLVADIMETVSRQMRSGALMEADPNEELALNRTAKILLGLAEGMRSSQSS